MKHQPVFNHGTTSLFDNRETWKATPSVAFDAFVLSERFIELGRRPEQRGDDGELKPRPPIRERSAKMYRAMFGRFLRWMEERNTDLFLVTAVDLIAFLNSRRATKVGKPEEVEAKVLNSRIRVRYLRMLERIYAHLKMAPNPASEAAKSVFDTKDAAGQDAPKVWLTLAEQKRFMTALPPCELRTAEIEPISVSSTKAWRRRRDRAMLCMLLGAGVTVAELAGLYVENVGEPLEDGSVPITISPGATGGVKRKHVTVLRPFAVQEVLDWLEEREALRFPKKFLFPSGRTGSRVDETTVYLLVRETLRQAGIQIAHMGPRTLRNTFAHRELAAGVPIEDVMEFMGFHEERSIGKYLVSARIDA